MSWRRVARSTSMAVLLLLLGVWGGWLIYRTSFEAGGQRYFCLFDDAMISMTYARNLVEGHGLNWARWGEPVEGFTHPLWTFLMVPPLLASGDLVAGVSRRFAERFRAAGLVARALPFDSPAFDWTLYWHRRDDQGMAHRWMRELVKEAFAAVAAGRA